jgi:hypothetical protein
MRPKPKYAVAWLKVMMWLSITIYVISFWSLLFLQHRLFLTTTVIGIPCHD